MMNGYQLQGNLTKDPEMFTSPAGNPYCRFSIAWNSPGKGDDRKVHFFDCTAFGKTAELIVEYFPKGRQILIEGRMEQRRWKDKETGDSRSRFNLVVEELHFQQRSNRQDDDGGGSNTPAEDDDQPF